MPSSTIIRRTTFFSTDRKALLGLLAEVVEVSVVALLGEEGRDGLVAGPGQRGVALVLGGVRVVVDRRDLVAGKRQHAVEHLVGVVEEQLELAGLADAEVVDELLLGLAQLLDDRLDLLDGLADDLLGRLGGAHVELDDDVVGGLGLDHQDGDLAVVLDAAGDDHLEDDVLLEFLEARERDPLAVAVQGVAHRRDRAVERHAGQHRRQRRAVHRHDVVGVELRGLQDRVDDLDLVAQAVDEGRAQRTVGQPAGEDGVLTGTSLTLEERAGDAARRVHPLLDLDGQGEEAQEVLGRDDAVVVVRTLVSPRLATTAPPACWARSPASKVICLPSMSTVSSCVPSAPTWCLLQGLTRDDGGGAVPVHQ
jgi:hypothetical protein